MSETDSIASAVKPRFVGRRFWGVLLLLVVISLPLGLLLGMRFQGAWKQRETRDRIEQLGGEVTYDYQVEGDSQDQDKLKVPPWLQALLGVDFFHSIKGADLSDTTTKDGDLKDLTSLTDLDFLDLRATKISDEGLEHLLALEHLTRLDVRETAVTADGIKQLKLSRPNLEIAHNKFARPAEAFVRRTTRKVPLPDVRGTGLGQKVDEDPTGKKGKGDADPMRGTRPSLKTESAIESGLAFLARRQHADGRWSLGDAGEVVALKSDTSATGLALLAFLGAGYDHLTGPHKDAVKNGLSYLIDNQRENGDLHSPDESEPSRFVWLYSHGIASIALCEAYGMTADEELREPAQRALDFIVASQHEEYGGWRYRPGVGSDTSVTGWLVMALKSGQLAGLKVPKKTFDGVTSWFDRAQASPSDAHLYVYNPLAADTYKRRHGRLPNDTMTSVGLLMRLYLGSQRDNPDLVRGAEHLLKNLPKLGTLSSPQRDSYYWYYATQVMLHMQGQYWQKWNAAIHSMLCESQITEGDEQGSWDPFSPVPDRWASHAGRHYVTTLNLLTLEVYYRHLPIYEDTAR